MSDNIEMLRDTIVPKSDQLNADDLLTGPITVKIAGVRRGNAEQPVDLLIEGRLPYKPCKSMRRALITAWGDDGREWVGRSITLYADPDVKFGGVRVGGIRISHMSHIEADIAMSLTATRGKRAPHLVRRLEGPASKPLSAKALAAIEAAKSAGRTAAAAGHDSLIAWVESLNEKQREFLAEFIDELKAKTMGDGAPQPIAVDASDIGDNIATDVQ